MIQVQPTPLPPLPEVVVAPSGPPEWVAIVAVVALIGGVFILLPLVRALARRIEGRGAEGDLRAELEAVHARLAELEQTEARLAELENRIEFSERLLTRHREALPERGETS